MDTIDELVTATLRRHVHPAASIVRRTETRMGVGEQGYSGARLARQTVIFRTPAGTLETMSLITKDASPIERRVLHRLLAQGQCVPFNHSLDLTTEAPKLVCQQDLGFAPTAGIPAPDLPRADHAYFAEVILADYREQLARARERPAFALQCGAVARQIEEAVEPFLAGMAALWAQTETRTLIHADMMDTHVLVHEGRPYCIDWGQARYGSFYLDLPNYFTPIAYASIERRLPSWAL